MTASTSHFALFDGDEGSAVLLTDLRRSIGSIDPAADDLAAVFAAADNATKRGEWVALAADYELASCFDPAMSEVKAALPRLRGWVFGCAEHLDAKATQRFLAQQVAEVPPHDRISGVADLVFSLDAERHAEKVERIRQWITEGDCYQVNLTFQVGFRAYGHPLALYASLRERQPVRYGAFIRTPDATVLSFSPELFFERRGSRVVTRPMKGTAPRGATRFEDEANRAALLASLKERAENIMIVDLLRNDLGRLADPGNVSVEALCDAEAYPTLWQMVSTVAAELPGVSLYEIFRALFPCGSITGAPKIRAMRRIAELEEAPRHLYTGALGWIAPGGDCRFNVAIRTLEIGERGQGRLGVGSGIVIDADPAKEYAECLLKARFITGLDPGFELIETIRLEDGVYPLLSMHMERLQASASSLGYACDLQVILSALTELALAQKDGVYRVRLTLAHGGQFKLTRTSMPQDRTDWQIVLADETLDCNDYLLKHKTTARLRYDEALARLAATPEVLDVIFCNASGEICEGARSNVYVERNGRLLTPPLSSGLLPGVMRRHLLETGRAVEHALCRDDLLQASAIYVSNALRGLVPVTLRREPANRVR